MASFCLHPQITKKQKRDINAITRRKGRGETSISLYIKSRLFGLLQRDFFIRGASPFLQFSEHRIGIQVLPGHGNLLLFDFTFDVFNALDLLQDAGNRVRTSTAGHSSVENYHRRHTLESKIKQEINQCVS
eukprot:GEMP01031816.1.p1 GENE.GEMP01031816.1~~GEMP01031816.1.p1  ORF type:complete len:131 (-),score=4.69 GEMP01031816.1:3-395(-)